MMERWQLQDAKNRFSEVVEKAIQDGPQIVTIKGVEAIVVMSMEEYQRLTRPRTDLVEFFRRSPLAGIALDLERK